MFRRSLVLFLLLAATAAFAQRTNRTPDSPGTGDPTEHDVPWKFLEKGVAPAPAPLILYWLPANAKETEQSPLLTSRALFEASARCVSYLVVLPGDSATVAKLHVNGELPEAVITDSHGTVVRTVNAVHGALPIAAVERAVHDELNARDEAMYHGMTEARKIAATDKNGAIALYRKVWDDRCLFPMAGTEAQHALKELGVVVTEPVSAPLPDPNLMKPGLPSKPAGH